MCSRPVLRCSELVLWLERFGDGKTFCENTIAKVYNLMYF